MIYLIKSISIVLTIMSNLHDEKVLEIINHIKTYFDNSSDKSIDEDDFLDLFERYVDYICDVESYDDKLTRLSSRLYQQLQKDGLDVIDKKSHEFYAIIENEEKEMDNSEEFTYKTNAPFEELPNQIVSEILSTITDMLENFEFQNKTELHKKCQEIEDFINQVQIILNRGQFNDDIKNNHQSTLDQLKTEYEQMKSIYSTNS
ncbi:putative orfan [Tupanvirus soda lake]|uniref:Orfan n=2 Tax=Tupanvirus TaxID=2094720 RepID=A0AC62AE09_9VIRU|nr:putative orfan [Tupanvirus soda lake]QKU35903.1 putative orfan [Tupanvirus soda lake]